MRADNIRTTKLNKEVKPSTANFMRAANLRTASNMNNAATLRITNLKECK
jgi:hypothetical protein